MSFNNKHCTIGFIGAGNMASAMILGIIEKGIITANKIFAYDIDSLKLSHLSEKSGVNKVESNIELVKNSSVIILAVKPNICSLVLEDIKQELCSEHILISIAAGVSTDSIKQIIQNRCKVVRTMPNIPVTVGEGMFAISNNHGLSENEFKIVKELLSSLGKIEEVDENLFNVVTAISGSSPAYVYLFIEALSDGAVLMGMKQEQAYRIAAQAILGSAKLMLESGKHPGVLKDMVCSPGGTTIEAIYSLEKNSFRGAVMDAVKTCVLKGEKIERG